MLCCAKTLFVLVTLCVGPASLDPDSDAADGVAVDARQARSDDGDDSHHLTQYILQRLLHESRRESDREQAEKRIFSNGHSQKSSNNANNRASIVYPQHVQRRNDGQLGGGGYGVDNPIRRFLDQAKEQIDVIDFRKTRRNRPEYVRLPRQHPGRGEELYFSDETKTTTQSRRRDAPPPSKKSNVRGSDGSASEQVPVKLAFPGNDFDAGDSRAGCTNCVPEGGPGSPNRWTMPLQRLGTKQYYLGVFFKANWYKAEQYCRFHGMHLASINSAEEQRDLQEHIQAYGMGHEHFWTSGTDQAEEGKFFWMSNGRPVTYSNWNAGEPNNFEYEDGEQEHCLEMWDRDGKGLGWNDTPCSFQTYFICEA